VRIFRELLVDCRFQPGLIEELFEIVRMHLPGKVEVWKLMLTSPCRDRRFERTLHRIAGEIICSTVLSVVEQKLCVFHSKVREISEINTVECDRLEARDFLSARNGTSLVQVYPFCRSSDLRAVAKNPYYRVLI